ncbi:Bud-site selection protein [Flammula alnicola]|nr:Bud-site selection protein [Flammula alnicola]
MKMDQSATRGVKRKRYEPPEEELSVRIGGKLHHEMKEVHKASKRAKVFETQKVVKRLKNLRKKDEDDKAIAEFEAELTSLKDINHDAIGNSALKSKVLKDHTLRENEDIKVTIKNELETNLLVPAEPGTTLAKIQSRLLSSKILAAQVSASLDSLKVLLNPALKQRDSATDSQPDVILAQSSDRPSKIRKESTSGDVLAQSKSKMPNLSLEVEDEEGGTSDSSRDEVAWKSGSLNGEGELEEDDGGWESGSISGGGSRIQESEDEESEEELDSDDEELKVKPTKSKPQKAAPKPAKSSSSKMESTFLPSLSVGFVRGSDDSDFSDTEGKAVDLQKKNRRGQRARRAIWEKKFGRNANHKKKEAEAMAAVQAQKIRGHTSSIKTGSNAVPSRNLTPAQGPPASTRGQSRGKNIPQHQQPVDAGWGTRSTGASAARVFKPATKSKSDQHDEKPLHPSWEAKRKLKARESVGIVPSQGTKIKFA